VNGRTALRWSGYVAFAVAFAVACAFLSNWQFTRGAERDAQLALIAANYDADPVPLAELVPSGTTYDPADQWRPVLLAGEYLPEQTLLVRNRPHGGTSAFEILVPLRTEDGRIVIVDRGWVPPGEDQPEPDAIPAPPSGQVTVIARLRTGEPLPPSGRSAPDGQVPTINLPLIADAIPDSSAVVPGAYALMVSEDPVPATTPRAVEAPSEDPGPHLSYAIQWILFAIMGFVFIWYMIRTEIRHRREDQDAEPAAGSEGAGLANPGPARPVAASARRRDRDAAEEDALLDELTSR